MTLNGEKIASEINAEIAREVSDLKAKGIKPHLATLLVGNDPASRTYVINKSKACEEVGIVNTIYRIAGQPTYESIYRILKMLNDDNNVHGILVQLPLPSYFDTLKLLNYIDPLKDVDCLNSINIGALYTNNQYTKPCTPAGVIELLDRYQIPIAGKTVCIFGRSHIVGRPMAELFLQRDASVKVFHSKSYKFHMERALEDSDIIVSAVGQPNFITTPEYGFRKGTVLIDIGINRDENNKLCGDINPDAYSFAEHYTPVPGGVGPMTVAMLLKNLITCAKVWTL
jgi:methylenetetrahydrofolate dehydrogenase (NADP+)/methenyltetrahydrofolate cyclohydrolase